MSCNVYIMCAGMILGMLANGKDVHLDMYANNLLYSIVAMGLLGTISGLRPFTKDRLVFYRESASGLSRLAYFFALDTFGHIGSLFRATCYIVPWSWYAQPRTKFGDMLLISVFVVYSCTGMGYFLSQVGEVYICVAHGSC